MTRALPRRTLVAYDIPDDKRRSRVAHLLESYGDRVQFSVFVVDASPARLVRLRSELARAIHPSLDSILLCDLGPTAGVGDSSFAWIGLSRPVTTAGSFIV